MIRVSQLKSYKVPRKHSGKGVVRVFAWVRGDLRGGTPTLHFWRTRGSVFSLCYLLSQDDGESIVEVCTILCLIWMSPLRISLFGFLPQISNIFCACWINSEIFLSCGQTAVWAIHPHAVSYASGVLNWSLRMCMCAELFQLSDSFVTLESGLAMEHQASVYGTLHRRIPGGLPCLLQEGSSQVTTWKPSLSIKILHLSSNLH